MNLKSFGCSFIYGNELSDEVGTEVYLNPSQLTWPALLSKQYDYGYQCYARPGSGNLQIAEKVNKRLGAEIIVSESNDPRSYRQNSDKF